MLPSFTLSYQHHYLYTTKKTQENMYPEYGTSTVIPGWHTVIVYDWTYYAKLMLLIIIPSFILYQLIFIPYIFIQRKRNKLTLSASPTKRTWQMVNAWCCILLSIAIISLPLYDRYITSYLFFNLNWSDDQYFLGILILCLPLFIAGIFATRIWYIKMHSKKVYYLLWILSCIATGAFMIGILLSCSSLMQS